MNKISPSKGGLFLFCSIITSKWHACNKAMYKQWECVNPIEFELIRDLKDKSQRNYASQIIFA
jgi:hypothetical protein